MTLEVEPLLTPAEVSGLFRVDPKTVTRWAKTGRITSLRTLGGHRRYRETEVRALLKGEDTGQTVPLQSIAAALLEPGDRVYADGAILTISVLSPSTTEATRAHGARQVWAGRWTATFEANEKVLIAPRPADE